MQLSVKVVDWTPGTQRQSRPALRLVSQTLTAGELIAQRVQAECRTLNPSESLSEAEQEHRVSAWLVRPGRLEQALNGGERVYGPGMSAASLDVDAQVAVARKAFDAAQFVMLFDGKQVESWDERITIREDSLATFIKLIPLRGG